MENSELSQHLEQERKFMHDISNQLLIAQGMGNFVLKKLREDSQMDAKTFEKLEKSMLALGQMVELIKKRHNLLRSKNISTIVE